MSVYPSPRKFLLRSLLDHQHCISSFTYLDGSEENGHENQLEVADKGVTARKREIIKHVDQTELAELRSEELIRIEK